MRVILVWLALCASGCAGASGLAIANVTALGVSSAALVCDWSQTRGAAEQDWIRPLGPNTSRVYSESNPIMGPRPSTGEVDAYFAVALGLTALAWRMTPRRYRWAVPAVVTAIQAAAIASNVLGGAQLPLCGL